VDDVLVKHLLKTEVPVLLVNGGRDSVQSARAARDAYAEASRCELTYWELPDYDHFMTDSDGNNHREEVFARISAWIGSALSGDAPGCP
jgi:alpha-beta hydrolase superfamily lysophospholipase